MPALERRTMMNLHPLPAQVDHLLHLALSEDIGTGDLTTTACVPADVEGAARLIAKDLLVLAGLPFFQRVFEILDGRVEVVAHFPDGTLIPPGTVVAELSGPARSILVGERTALNVLQRLSGTATLTRRWVEAIDGTVARICDTRKTTPGMRYMQKYAVAVAGGSNHRFGLDSGVLIKDNHIAACGGLTAAVERCRRSAPHLLKIEVEVVDLGLVDEAIAAGADVILLDNMPTDTMIAAVHRIRDSGKPILIEASGGLTLARAREVAETGVDLLSVGALTHSAPSADLSLDF
jgi:nicotinate-nucleotide pyrophosphorylase (carboxylating)